MKTIRLISALLLVVQITFNSYSACAEEKSSKVKLVIAGDYWCPYNCLPNSDKPGFLVEIAQRAFYIYEIDVEYKMMPWSQALEKINTGEIDGILGISVPSAKNLVTTKLPLEYSLSGVYTRNDTEWVYDGIESLKGKKISFIMDYVIDESINTFFGSEYTKDPRMFSIEDSEKAVIESIANLLDKKSDVYIEDERVVNYYIKQNNLKDSIKYAGRVTKNKLPIYIAFSPKTANIKKYIKFLEEGIASLKATGEYDEIMAKYDIE